MNDEFVKSLQDRYEVINDWPSPMAMIPNTGAPQAATMITDELSLQKC
jgi:hypothetical protein